MGEKTGKSEKGREITIMADIRPNPDRGPLHVSVRGTVEELDEMLATIAEVGERIRGNVLAMEVVSGTLKMIQAARAKAEAERPPAPPRRLDPAEIQAEREKARQEGSPQFENLNVGGGEARRKEGLQQFEELHLHGKEE